MSALRERAIPVVAIKVTREPLENVVVRVEEIDEPVVVVVHPHAAVSVPDIGSERRRDLRECRRRSLSVKNPNGEQARGKQDATRRRSKSFRFHVRKMIGLADGASLQSPRGLGEESISFAF